MGVVNSVPLGSTEPVSASPLDFTRSLFIKNNRVHIESLCNQCGFRIVARTSDFDREEQEHASLCEGSHTE